MDDHARKNALCRAAIVGLGLATFSAFPACSEQKKTDKPAAAKSAPETPAPTGKAVIKGTVKFEGAVPAAEPWGGTGNAECKKLHDETIQLVRAKDGKLEDAFVYVKEGLPKGSYPVSDKPATFHAGSIIAIDSLPLRWD